MKFLNVDLIRSRQRKMFLRTQDICERIGIGLDDWYTCINYTQRLQRKIVKDLCEVLNIRKEDIYEQGRSLKKSTRNSRKEQH